MLPAPEKQRSRRRRRSSRLPRIGARWFSTSTSVRVYALN